MNTARTPPPADPAEPETTAQAIADWAMGLARKEVTRRLGGKADSGSGGSSSGGGSADASEPGGGKHVTKLSASSFDKEVLKSAEPWMVEFYAPWCGHCKQLSPHWAKAAAETAGKGVRFGAVDCTAHEALCARYSVNGYPTIKLFGADKSAPEARGRPIRRGCCRR